MIWRIVQKELLSHLLTLRFALGGLCCLALIASSAYVLTRQFEGRLEAHRSAVTGYEGRLQTVKVYSELGQAVRPEAHRPPNPLSILCGGVEGELGDHVALAHGYVPVSAVSSGSDNPYLAVFPSVDFVTVFQVVLSLLALLFAYDAVCGEQEDGTLKLTLAGAVPRSSVLLGKYVGALLALTIPLLLSLGVGLLVATSSEYVSLNASDWARVGLILAASLLYLSLFYLAGALCSCAVDRSASALALCLFAWVGIVLIYPGAVVFGVDRLRPAQSDQSVNETARALVRQIREKAEVFLSQRGVGSGQGDRGRGRANVWEGVRSTSMSTSSSGDDNGSGETVKVAVQSAKDPELTLQRDFYRFQEHLRIEVTDQVWQLRKDYLERNPLRQARLSRNLSRLSPAAVYGDLSAVLAGTDLGAHHRFMDQARAYRREVIQYFTDRDAFGSRAWFSDDRGKADVAGLPRFRWRPETAGEAVRRGWEDLAILAGWNGALFWIAYILFAKRSVA
jgi:ABC-type transport system involved in multi-copper enzyme maturation permease subunit